MRAKGALAHLPWLVLGLVGAFALATVATERGEPVNALWFVVAAVATYFVAYRYYALYIARNVMRLEPERPTPAVRRNDGLDHVPTNRTVLFGHHFAAIAGAGGGLHRRGGRHDRLRHPRLPGGIPREWLDRA
jgi:carbon starvation protein